MSNSPPRRWPFPIDQAEPLLVVDDQKMMVELARRVLSRLGFEKSMTHRMLPSAHTLTREKA